MTSEERILQTRVAWRYYHEGSTQADIAVQLGITRARVNKILQECHDQGVVQIIINAEWASCVEIESELEKKFGLTQAIVVPTPTKEQHIYGAIGKAAGNYISDHLRDGQGLGLGWGKTLRASIGGISQRATEDISLVSLFGGLPHSGATNPYDVAAMFSRRFNVTNTYYIAAPMYVSSEQIRKTLMTQPMFESIFERAADVDIALIGAGDLTARSTNVLLGALTKEEWRSLLDGGAVGEVFGYFLDEHGKPLDHPLNRRIMSADLEQLRRIPLKVIATGGLQKVAIITALLQGNFSDVLITDEVTAEAVLKSFLRGKSDA